MLYLTIGVYVHIYACVCVSVYVCLCERMRLSVSVCVCVYVSACERESVCGCLGVFTCLSLYLEVRLSLVLLKSLQHLKIGNTDTIHLLFGFVFSANFVIKSFPWKGHLLFTYSYSTFVQELAMHQCAQKYLGCT